MCVPTGHVHVFQEGTCLESYEHVSAPLAHVCVFTCAHMCVPRVHICVFKCAHMCVPTGHVFVFQEKTCMLSDERVCVRVCLGLLRVHMYVCSFVHVRSDWTRVCVSGEYMFGIR